MSFPTSPVDGQIYKEYIYNSTNLIWEKADPSKYFPIGFIYTQYPGKPDPSTLGWYGVWENKSSEYAGDFFRAEGGSASVFGGGEQTDALQGHHHDITAHTSAPSTGYGLPNPNSAHGSIESTVDIHGWSVTALKSDGVSGTPRIDSETRPINQTIRIWERVS